MPFESRLFLFWMRHVAWLRDFICVSDGGELGQLMKLFGMPMMLINVQKLGSEFCELWSSVLLP